MDVEVHVTGKDNTKMLDPVEIFENMSGGTIVFWRQVGLVIRKDQSYRGGVGPRGL